MIGVARTSPTPIATNTDLDTNNDGTLDLPSGATVLDGVGWLDPSTPGGTSYAPTVALPGAPLNPPQAFPVESSNGLRGWSSGAELTAEWQATPVWRLHAGWTEFSRMIPGSASQDMWMQAMRLLGKRHSKKGSKFPCLRSTDEF